MTGSELYSIFMGMRLHFSQKRYDYRVYGPKKCGDAEIGRNYVLAQALGPKFGKDSLEQRCIALMKTKNYWLNEIDTPTAKQEERKHLADTEGWLYNLKSHLKTLEDESGSVQKSLEVKSQFQVPEICSLLLSKQISLETFVVLDNLLGFAKNIPDLLWNEQKLRIEKYKAFFKPDLKEAAKVARPFF